MRTLSLDLRERILTSYDQEECSREEIAVRYQVSLGMVKKLLQQRRHTGDISPRHRYSGRKPKLLGSHRQQMRKLLNKKPDLTLKELRSAMQLSCSLPAVHYVLEAMGLTYKKRHSAPVNKTVRTSSGRGGAGSGSRPVGIRPGWSSSMNRGQKQI
jgi:transposase